MDPHSEDLGVNAADQSDTLGDRSRRTEWLHRKPGKRDVEDSAQNPECIASF